MAAALTPRVRILVLCDEVFESETEPGVFTLDGVRQQLSGTFPLYAELNLFLNLQSPRKGHYRGSIVIVREETDKAIRYKKFHAEFDEENQGVSLCVNLGWCEFRESGRYAVQVWFFSGSGNDVLKAELPFDILENQE